ncbi:MAG: redox-sensing transcriptional repressor Rex [Clostridia bacterium]|nr:redox-sensing transcriptional repressor Rex [Clostridia bacterium]
MGGKQISENVISRLPKYYRYLQELEVKKINRVSSKQISEALNLTASQVRQDLSNFGGFGQQGYGYDVDYLKACIREILGLNTFHNAIIIGGGRIGQALANYKGFASENVYVRAVFDINVSKVAKIDGVDVYDMAELDAYVSNHKVDVAIISVQKEEAKKVAEKVVALGVKAIWNFAPIDLNFGSRAVCENINMSESLMRLIYKAKS